MMRNKHTVVEFEQDAWYTIYIDGQMTHSGHSVPDVEDLFYMTDDDYSYTYFSPDDYPEKYYDGTEDLPDNFADIDWEGMKYKLNV